MKCPACNQDMVLTKATNFGDEYHYCRGCKKELSEIKADGDLIFSVDYVRGCFKEQEDIRIKDGALTKELDRIRHTIAVFTKTNGFPPIVTSVGTDIFRLLTSSNTKAPLGVNTIYVDGVPVHQTILLAPNEIYCQ